ncbi:MAG TPA: DUF350 domain-containing protein [Azospirillaceae bacterium]|nr:DUF350 domain-containing protein [Azospirillaceae bacterium]
MSIIEAVIASLGSGLPVLLVHLAAALGLLAVGAASYMALTPFNERQLVAEGNAAAGTVLAGALIGLALPLAATLASSEALLDILLWGLVAIVLQLLALVATRFLVGDLGPRIQAGSVAAALPVVGVQVATGLLNAAAMAG